MTIENLSKLEKAVYAATKFKEDPGLSLDSMVDFLRDGSEGSKVSLDHYWHRVKAEAEVELEKYETFRGGIAEAMQDYASQYQKEFDNSTVKEIVSYSEIKLSDDEEENFEKNKYLSRTYKELVDLRKDEDKTKEMSEEDQTDLAIALNLVNMSRAYRFNKVGYDMTRKRIHREVKKILKLEEKKDKDKK